MRDLELAGGQQSQKEHHPSCCNSVKTGGRSEPLVERNRGGEGWDWVRLIPVQMPRKHWTSRQQTSCQVCDGTPGE